MDYEWNERKRAINITYHGVDFKNIEKFDWATCLTVLDTRFKEPRYATLGLINERLHFVAYTIRKLNIRLISMRKANKREVKKYEHYISQ